MMACVKNISIPILSEADAGLYIPEKTLRKQKEKLLTQRLLCACPSTGLELLPVV
jgi:hypothetical protein